MLLPDKALLVHFSEMSFVVHKYILISTVVSWRRSFSVNVLEGWSIINVFNIKTLRDVNTQVFFVLSLF
jgi:hypothetical protein